MEKNIWKYSVSMDPQKLDDIEKHFKLILPKEFKDFILSHNKSKPTINCFNAANRMECVLDYILDANKLVEISKRINVKDFLPFAIDPFGNFIGFQIVDSKIGNVVFWDHENDVQSKISTDFTSFINSLYEID